MGRNDNDSDEAIVAKFHVQILADRESSKDLPLEHYQRLFPGHDAVVAREFNRVAAGFKKPLVTDADNAIETHILGTSDPGRSSDVPVFPGLDNICEVGAGGMGRVYRAREQTLDRVVAVKTVKPSFLTSDGRAFFEREAKAAAAIDHPHIVKVFSFNPDHDPPYYLMQFVDGDPLDRACAGKNVRYAAALFAKIARALAVAHRHDIVHRDIKPANILVDRSGEPRIADFGLAKRLDPFVNFDDETSSSFKGTPRFIAPEVWDDPSNSGPAADVYALGVSLYEVLCHRPPFRAGSLHEMRAAVLEGRPPLPQELVPDLAEPLQRIVLKAMECEPDDRYESAASMAEDLERFLTQREILARPRRYRSELHGRLREHVADINLWHEARLVDQTERDRLARVYRRMLDEDSPWRELVRRFPWETLSLRLGGWLVLVASILWPVFYWEDLDKIQRVLVTGAPVLTLGLTGVALYWRKSRTNSVTFLAIALLLMPLFVVGLLSEYGWLSFLQPTTYELFEKAGHLPKKSFSPTNFQMLAAFAFFGIMAIALLLRVRARIFCLFCGGAAYLTYSAMLLRVGAKSWADSNDVKRVVFMFIPLTLSFAPMARLLRHRAQGAWAPLFYLFFPVPFACCLTLFARFAGAEWFVKSTGPDWDAEPIQHLLMANAAVYAVIALVGARARAEAARFWVPFFCMLIPMSLLVPCNVLFEKGLGLFMVGCNYFTVYEAAAAGLSIGLVAVGTRLNRNTLTIPGLMGFAVFLMRATERHFEKYTAWPLALAACGVVAMAVGLVVTVRRSRAVGM